MNIPKHLCPASRAPRRWLLWMALEAPGLSGNAAAGALMRARAVDGGPLAAPTAGGRLMKRGTATLLFCPRPRGPLSPVWIPLWLLTCSLTRARTPLRELTSSGQQQRFHLRWKKKKNKPTLQRVEDNFGQACSLIRLANFYSSFQKPWLENNAELFFF